MDHGKMIQVDTPDRIYETPNSVYVADFIGDVNIVEGTATPKGDGKVAISWAEGQPEISASMADGVAPGTRVHFAIRPEKVAISSDRPEGRANVIEGTVHDIAYLGNISTYKVEVAGGRMIKAQVANDRRIARRDISWDDKVWLSFTDTAGVVLLN
jgi:putrescine transport system ATP-binding protein